MEERTATVTIQLIQTAGSVLKWSVVAYFAYRGISELAGKETEALLSASLDYSTGINIGLIVLTIASTLYGLWERKFRIRKIKYLTDRNIKLEEAVDPGRSTSGLPSSGNTHPEDK